MCSPSDASMEEIPLEDDEQDSIEYKILMAYAQRRLSVSKYRKLLKNEANVQKSSLIGRKVETDHQRDKEGPTLKAAFQDGVIERQSKKQSKRRYLPGYCLPFFCSRAEQEKSPTLSLQQGHAESPEAHPKIVQERNSQRQTRFTRGNKERAFKYIIFSESGPIDELIMGNTTHSETADVNHIADKLAKLVTSRSWESPSDVSFRTTDQGLRQKQDSNNPTDEIKDEEKIIQTIVSLLRQKGDRLEEKIKKDKVFNQHFKDMLSYTFFKRITELFLEDVSAVSTSEPGDQVQCTKVAFTMEVATRLTAVDNHPMNLVLGFGLKYLREHFKPWIQDRGGWEKVLTSLDEEEVE